MSQVAGTRDARDATAGAPPLPTVRMPQPSSALRVRPSRSYFQWPGVLQGARPDPRSRPGVKLNRILRRKRMRHERRRTVASGRPGPSRPNMPSRQPALQGLTAPLGRRLPASARYFLCSGMNASRCAPPKVPVARCAAAAARTACGGGCAELLVMDAQILRCCGGAQLSIAACF